MKQPVMTNGGETALQDVGGIRSGDDDFSVDQFLIELGVLALLVGGGDEGMALAL